MPHQAKFDVRAQRRNPGPTGNIVFPLISLLGVLSPAAYAATPSAPTAVVLCSPATATVLRADRRLDGASVGVISAKSCGIVSRRADGVGVDRAAGGVWMFLEKSGVGTGWAFIPLSESEAWTYDLSVPEMMRLKAERDLAASGLAVEANLAAIKTAELASDAVRDRFVSAPTCPTAVPPPSGSPWTGDCAEGWTSLGWRPDGMTTCSYTAVALAPAAFFLLAQCDADGDGAAAVYRLDHPGGGEVQRLTPESVR